MKNFGALDECSYDISTDDLDWIDNVAYQNYDFESDIYNDLITVESKLKELIDNGHISKDEIKIMNYILSGRTISQIERGENITRPTLLKKFSDVCSRVAFHLGGIFTDDGYLNMIIDKYNLTNEEIEKAKTFMSEIL